MCVCTVCPYNLCLNAPAKHERATLGKVADADANDDDVFSLEKVFVLDRNKD